MTVRARIGAVGPDDDYPEDFHFLDELRSFLPEGVRLDWSPTPPPTVDVTVEFLISLAESTDIEEAARKLVPLKPACIMYPCTSCSFVKGVGYDEEISRRIEAATGVPATTTSTAMVRALRALGIEKVAVGAPYLQEVTDTLTKFLEDSGFAVVKVKTLNMTRGRDIFRLPYEEVAHLIRETDAPEAEGIFISCTNLRTATIIEDLEREMRKPVVTANQATVWDALRIMGMSDFPGGVGCLFSHA